MAKDVIIIGAGPAGLTAGIYCLRARMNTVVIEKFFPGGGMLITEKVDNYPGFPEGVSGPELAEKMQEQYVKFGGEILQGEVEEVLWDAGGEKKVKLKSGQEVTGRVLIIASGSSRKKIEVEGESEYTGRGVSFCAVCDGAFFKDKKIAVVGGGDSALEEVMYLTRYADVCYLIHRRDKFRASPHLQEEMKKYPSIKPVLSSTVEKIEGDGKLVKRIILRQNETGHTQSLDVSGVFVSIGQKPNVEFISGKVEQNPAGYIVTDCDMQSSVKGVFACGDVIKKPLYQVVTACSEGAIAAFSAEKYLSHLKEKK
jgi:thioredoxin reductase (NADPH)